MASITTYVIRVAGEPTTIFWESAASSPREVILEFEAARKQLVATLNGADRSRFFAVGR